MRTVGNIIWVVLCGVWSAIGWLIAAAFLTVTVIGIPFARQCLKLGRFTLWPFGWTAVPDPTVPANRSLIGNILWFIPGVLLALSYAISGILMAVTIIGIPFAVQAWKMIPVSLSPFGKQIVRIRDVQVSVAVR